MLKPHSVVRDVRQAPCAVKLGSKKPLAVCVGGVSGYKFYFMQFGSQLVYIVDNCLSYTLKNKDYLMHPTVKPGNIREFRPKSLK